MMQEVSVLLFWKFELRTGNHRHTRAKVLHSWLSLHSSLLQFSLQIEAKQVESFIQQRSRDADGLRPAT